MRWEREKDAHHKHRAIVRGKPSEKNWAAGKPRNQKTMSGLVGAACLSPRFTIFRFLTFPPGRPGFAQGQN
jgi:hypothetical protein